MLTTLVYAALVASFAQVTVDLAPDQPVPHVYADDPLVIELQSSVAGKFDVELTFVSETGETTVLHLDKVYLPGDSPRWYTLDDLPIRRGRYRVRIEVHGPLGNQTLESSFSRIDRPSTSNLLPITVASAGPDDPLHHALRSLPVSSLRFDALQPDLEERIAHARKSGLTVVVRLSVRDEETFDETQAQKLAESLGDSVSTWEISTGSDPDRFIRIAQALRRGAPRTRMDGVVHNTKEVRQLLAGGTGQFLRGIVVESAPGDKESLLDFRHAARSVGVEGIVFGRSHTAAPDAAPVAAPVLTRQLINDMANGAQTVDVEARLLFAEDAFQEGYCYLSALANRMGGSVYIGDMDTGSKTQARVFRRPEATGTGHPWLIVFWSEGEGRPFTVSVEGASHLALTDALNNPVAFALDMSKTLVLTSGTAPQYLRGEGGSILASAACASVRRAATSLLEDDRFDGVLDEDQRAGIADLTECTPDSAMRLQFFLLLRMFPGLESLYHSGTLDISVAVPLIAQIADLAGHLSVVQEERAERLLEPLNETLARCSEYQSLYLTGTGGRSGSGDRADWLLTEVDRLVERARNLARSGRPIEANAIAAVGEWRARSLQSLMQVATSRGRIGLPHAD